jgi:hypothetical protein
VVAYTPPDKVLLTVGGSFPTDRLLAAAERIVPLVRIDIGSLLRFAIEKDVVETISGLIADLKNLSRDPRAKKHDTPLQMAEIAEQMARARAWLKTLREIAAVNLALDTPALARISSTAPELVEGYARDLLAELELRVEAARDMKPRLEETGLSDAFLARGRTLAQQMKTAIGAKDVDPGNLHFTVRRLYAQKGALYLLLKRITRAARLAFLTRPDRASAYHLDEIEPVLIEPVFSEKRK